MNLALKRIQKYRQEHLTSELETLSLEEQKKVFTQILSWDEASLEEVEKVFLQEKVSNPSNWTLFKPEEKASEEDSKRGKKLLQEGALGGILLAGGQGSRLGIEGPKGLYPMTLIKKKSLFQIFCEKFLAAGKKYQTKFPLAVMTSPLNHEETVQFFKEQNYFGCEPEQIYFFSQTLLPFLDEKGKWFWSSRGKLAEGPDGNGGVFRHFYQKTVWKKFLDQGVRHVFVFPIDNPLADPFQSEVLGFHERKKNDSTALAILQGDTEKNMGIFIEVEKKIQVLEYLHYEQKSVQNAYANCGLFYFRMDFIDKIAKKNFSLPLYKTLKKTSFFDRTQEKTEKKLAWKYEQFLFDVFLYTSRVGVLCYPKETCYAPLKTILGEHGVEAVQKALLARDQKTVFFLFGSDVSGKVFELSQEFYYPTEELKKRWQGKKIEEGYIE